MLQFTNPTELTTSLEYVSIIVSEAFVDNGRHEPSYTTYRIESVSVCGEVSFPELFHEGSDDIEELEYKVFSALKEVMEAQ